MSSSLEYNLKGEKILVSLLNNDRFTITKNGKIKKLTVDFNEKNPVAADTYIGITKVLYHESTRTGKILFIHYQSNDNRIDDDFYATVNSTGTVRFDFNQIAESIKPALKEQYQALLLRIYKSYFTQCIKEELKRNPGMLYQCGWFSDESSKAFKAVNYRNDDNFKTAPLKIESLMFNGLLSTRLFTETSMEEYCQRTDHMRSLFSLLLSDGNALMMFTYCIHAILWEYQHGYYKFENDEIPNTDTALFSLCIYGNDIAQVKVLANLLVNVFDIPKGKWASISKSIHISASSINENHFFKLESLKDVPVLVTCKNDCFYKSSSIIKKFHTQREKGNFHVFPVYLSQKPISADEIVNCCADTITLDRKDSDKLYSIHNELRYLLYHFICYLTKISNCKAYSDTTPYHYIKTRTDTLIEELKKSNEEENVDKWLDYRLPEFLMIVSLDCFCHYLESTPLHEYCDKLVSVFVEYLNKKDRSNSSLELLPEVDYLKLFFCFLQETAGKEKNHGWVFNGNEPYGDKEECYYLSASDGYNKFISYLKGQKIPVISRQMFLTMLKSKNVLKMPKSGTSNSMKRKGIYVYVIKKQSCPES